MSRQLAKSTLVRLRGRLEEERRRLSTLLENFDRQREDMRLAETSSEHNSDPENMDGGSLAFEMEMDFSKEKNARDLLEKVNHALERMHEGTYGTCEISGRPIPVARLEALPYATTTVEMADRL